MIHYTSKGLTSPENLISNDDNSNAVSHAIHHIISTTLKETRNTTSTHESIPTSMSKLSSARGSLYTSPRRPLALPRSFSAGNAHSRGRAANLPITVLNIRGNSVSLPAGSQIMEVMLPSSVACLSKWQTHTCTHSCGFFKHTCIFALHVTIDYGVYMCMMTLCIINDYIVQTSGYLLFQILWSSIKMDPAFNDSFRDVVIADFLIKHRWH